MDPKRSEWNCGYSSSTHSVRHIANTYCHRNWWNAQRWLWYPGARVSRNLLDIDPCTHFHSSLRESGVVGVLSQAENAFGTWKYESRTWKVLIMLSRTNVTFSTNTLMDISRFCTNNFVSHRHFCVFAYYLQDWLFAQVVQDAIDITRTGP